MKLRLSIIGALAALSLSGQAMAADVFAGDGRVFSGIASDQGEGLIVPQTLTAGGITGFASTFDAGFGLENAMVVTTVGGGALADGLNAFPAVSHEGYDLQTRLTVGEVGWGLTPYFGVGVSNGNSNGVFQGIASLLPYESDAMGMQGVAGIAYQLMPGVGAGLEYRYQGYTASTPVARDAGDNQTIMMRLDLGLN